MRSVRLKASTIMILFSIGSWIICQMQALEGKAEEGKG
jgi:hypothetical protein